MSGGYLDNDVCHGCIQCQSITTSPSSKYFPLYKVLPLIQSTTFYTKYYLLYKVLPFIQSITFYTKYYLLYKVLPLIQSS